MYKNVLTISDNILLCVRFQQLINKKQLNGAHFSYGVSLASSVGLFKEKLNTTVQRIDLKDKNTVAALLDTYDLIFSIHCKQIFPEKIVNSIKCVNIHPGYNPINRGWYPQVFSIIHDFPMGATIHEMDEKLDHGKIIDRAFVKKEAHDTSETLYNKVIDKEMELLNDNIDHIMSGTYTATEPENEGNIFFKKDFEDLSEIDLKETVNTREFINRLRALTHGGFNNAFFMDPETGKKVYVSISLTPEGE